MGETLNFYENEPESLRIGEVIAEELSLTEDEKQLAFRATPTSWLSSLVLDQEDAFKGEDKKESKE